MTNFSLGGCAALASKERLEAGRAVAKTKLEEGGYGGEGHGKKLMRKRPPG